VADAWRERIYGKLDVPLAPLGEAQARRAARILSERPLVAVYSSGLARAEYTARLLREPRGLPRRDEPALCELERGSWAGQTFAELECAQPGAFAAWLARPSCTRPPNGESLEDLRARVLPVLERLAREHAGAELAIVSHCWVVRCLVCEALGLELDASPRLHLPTGALVTLDWPSSSAASNLPVLAAYNAERAPRRGGHDRGRFRG